MRRRSGFTLIEIMLVLVLISLASVAVISTLPISAEEGARKQAQALFHRIQLLNEEAILSGRDYGLHINEQRSVYTLMQLSSEGWQALEDELIPANTELSDELSIELQLGGSDWQSDDRLFTPGKLFDDEMFAEFDEQTSLPPPQVFIMSSGEVTPFSVILAPHNSKSEQQAWRVAAEENGLIKLLKPGEVSDETQ